MFLDHGITTLYKQGAKHLQVWKISVIGSIIVIEWGVEGGTLQGKTEEITAGKGGRSLHEQIASRVASRVNKQQLLGYKLSRAEALAGKSNALGFVQPMLALVASKAKVDTSKALVQYKYDGNRCLITRTEDGLVAYTRRGKVIDTIDHILDEIDIPLGTTLDGELYAHGHTLQEIVSWVRKKQPGTKRVRYHSYDSVSDKTYIERLYDVEDYLVGNQYSEAVPTWHIQQCKSLEDKFGEAREQGYEGLILRVGDEGYQPNKRSKSLLKVKEKFDGEFKIQDITLSSRGVPVIDCGIFDATAPGTYEEKRMMYNNREEYIGKMLHVEYYNVTKDGIPFQPIAKEVRNDV